MTPLELLGRWQLTRQIDDRHAGQVLHVTGTARLALLDQDVVWEESGVLSRPGAAAVEVARRLRVVRREGAGWWVCFEDGRDFHPWRPGAWVEHPCGADHYRGLVEVDLPSWRVTWEVSGPAKAYTMTSRLTPVD